MITGKVAHTALYVPTIQPRDAVLPTYRFNNFETDESIVIDGWSYLWAAFTGPLYVLSNGFYLLSLLMLVITVVIAALAFLGLLISVYVFDASIPGLVAMVVAVAGGFLVNAIVAVELVCRGYLRSGWRLGY